MRKETRSTRTRLSRTGLVAAVFCFALGSIAQACLWDWDTLQMERRRFPGVLELITGKFVRHSPEYYEWRIRDRSERMYSPAENPDLADDLAVAYSKLGNHAQGIAILEQALEAHPDRYETLANLGTIHMLAGDLKTGKEFVDRAIVINPNAHFGREKYQSLLAEYILTSRESPHPAAQGALGVIRPKGQYCGFAKFVIEKRGRDQTILSDDDVKEELAAAQKGVMGMMLFANYDSPLLLEALGDLLIAWPSYETDGLQLAARAYYRIAQLSDDDATRKQFQSAARNMLDGSLDYIKFRGDYKENTPQRDALEKLSADLEHELEEARAFIAIIAADEKRWIAQGTNVDAAFAAKYFDSLESTIDAANQQLSRERRDVRGNPYQPSVWLLVLVLGGFLAGLVGVATICFFAFRRIWRMLGSR